MSLPSSQASHSCRCVNASCKGSAGDRLGPPQSCKQATALQCSQGEPQGPAHRGKLLEQRWQPWQRHLPFSSPKSRFSASRWVPEPPRRPWTAVQQQPANARVSLGVVAGAPLGTAANLYVNRAAGGAVAGMAGAEPQERRQKESPQHRQAQGQRHQHRHQHDDRLTLLSKEMAQHLRHDPPEGEQPAERQRAANSGRAAAGNVPLSLPPHAASLKSPVPGGLLSGRRHGWLRVCASGCAG